MPSTRTPTTFLEARVASLARQVPHGEEAPTPEMAMALLGESPDWKEAPDELRAMFGFKWAEKLRRFGFNPKNVLDIGANKGNFARQANVSWPEAQFVCFDGSNLSTYWTDLMDSPNAKMNVAILDSTEHDADWFENPEEKYSTGNSLLKERTGFFREVQATKRRTKTLDGAVEELGFAPGSFELVKLDVQGAELNVMRGASKILAGTKAVLLEMPFAGQYNQGAPSFAEIVKFMDEAGFSPLSVAEVHTVKEVDLQVDFLYVRKDGDIAKLIQHNIDSAA